MTATTANTTSANPIHFCMVSSSIIKRTDTFTRFSARLDDEQRPLLHPRPIAQVPSQEAEAEAAGGGDAGPFDRVFVHGSFDVHAMDLCERGAICVIFRLSTLNARRFRVNTRR